MEEYVKISLEKYNKFIELASIIENTAHREKTGMLFGFKGITYVVYSNNGTKQKIIDLEKELEVYKDAYIKMKKRSLIQRILNN